MQPARSKASSFPDQFGCSNICRRLGFWVDMSCGRGREEGLIWARAPSDHGGRYELCKPMTVSVAVCPWVRMYVRMDGWICMFDLKVCIRVMMSFFTLVVVVQYDCL